MPIDVQLANVVKIRDLGLNEDWLQQYIFANPSCLGLGYLEPIERERKQKSGGILDILLKDAEDDSMYEVEVMLGATNETHIMRAIEYWDIEKRRMPNRAHYPVIVAEKVTERFFNILQILGRSIPIYAIQVNVLQAADCRIVSFIKILEPYIEAEDDYAQPQTTVGARETWSKEAIWCLKAADALADIAKKAFPETQLGEAQGYLSLSGQRRQFAVFYKRSTPKVLAQFRITDEKWEELEPLLQENQITPTRKPGFFLFSIDFESVVKKAAFFEQMMNYVDII